MTTDDKLVNTATAAALYGCSPKTIRNAMRSEGYEPVLQRTRMAHGGSRLTHWWHPKDVLHARSKRRIRYLERLVEAGRTMHKLVPKPGTKRFARAKALARVTRQETERRKILQRIAARDGLDVNKLYLAAGLKP